MREAWFVKRILDGRRRIPLAYSGESRFHTTATANLAVLSGDPLTVAEDDIRDITAQMTMVGGRIVHATPGWSG